MTTPSRRKGISRGKPPAERRSTIVKLERRKKPRHAKPEPMPQLPPHVHETELADGVPDPEPEPYDAPTMRVEAMVGLGLLLGAVIFGVTPRGPSTPPIKPLASPFGSFWLGKKP